MINKQWLIKISDVDNLWYDSEEKVYRYRMHCPNCKKESGCQCYHDLDLALIDIDDSVADYTCSNKCALLVNEWDDVGEAIQLAGLKKDAKKLISNLTDKQLFDIIKKYEFDSVLIALSSHNSNIPISHIKNPNHNEMVEIIFAVGDEEDVLDDLDISCYPELKDLSEEEAKKVLEILTEDADFDLYPHGENCK